jgi:hypothetical protein
MSEHDPTTLQNRYVSLKKLTTLQKENPEQYCVDISDIGGCITAVQHRFSGSDMLQPTHYNFQQRQVIEKIQAMSDVTLLEFLSEEDEAYQCGDTHIKWEQALEITEDLRPMKAPKLGLTLTGGPDRLFKLREGPTWILVQCRFSQRYGSTHKTEMKRLARLLAYDQQSPVDVLNVLIYNPNIGQELTASKVVVFPYHANVPKDIYDICEDTHWINKTIEVLQFGRMSAPKQDHQCIHCPYIHICRGYPYGVVPLSWGDV